jgi:CRP/FNR family transcriptional regulator
MDEFALPNAPDDREFFRACSFPGNPQHQAVMLDIIGLMAQANLPTSNTATKLLKQLPLFADLSEEDLAFLAQNTRFQRVEREQILFYQGDSADRIWLVQEGRVKIVYHDENGREVILELISAGEAFGGAVLFFPQHPATAMTMEASTIASFSSELYAAFLLDHPAVILKLLRMLGARHLSMINMQTLVGERVERRMAHILVKLALRVGKNDPEGVLITIPLSRQDLADMACTTLETAIRTISRFNSDGLVSTRRGGYLVVTDISGLEELTR